MRNRRLSSIILISIVLLTKILKRHVRIRLESVRCVCVACHSSSRFVFKIMLIS